MGRIEGVVATRPGWLERREVVEVRFDPRVLSFESLVARAEAARCASPVFTRSDAQQEVARALLGERAVRTDEAIRTEDDKYHLSRTPLRFLPLTPLQAARVNARVAEGGDPGDLLSPAQRRLLDAIEARPDAGWDDAIGRDFREAWEGAVARAAGLEGGAQVR